MFYFYLISLVLSFYSICYIILCLHLIMLLMVIVSTFFSESLYLFVDKINWFSVFTMYKHNSDFKKYFIFFL